MFKRSIITLSASAVCLLTLCSSLRADAQKIGKEISNKLGCGGSHSAILSAGSPFLKEISKAYFGKEKDLEETKYPFPFKL